MTGLIDDLVARDAFIDHAAAELKSIGNDPAMIDMLAASAKALKPGTPVHIPNRPFCEGYVANGVSETLCVHVTRTLDNMTGAFFCAPGYVLALRGTAP